MDRLMADIVRQTRNSAARIAEPSIGQGASYFLEALGSP